ncbi:hypothetical protein SPRG_01397 [Saprolegnia parasitica CBS 223.65]|uniref:Uncharacterized protein n=1 Tax=Saprolegnia parasitica (strain CBS 223.65) TaxID=695850 RepID=A0A067D555_SAPPC|nr:hypothetical protein SPRG_01397 [Saprolegnia parasitica CBS 223.65]KDO34127.1 hypothetical protein SPRG_01397 [Saprolegnia parasitica CBS 223.65]|eukprot:XP_012195004.1 hypothetical protein SPRG_01397 [Saprolegnia parasitica CBS 223.65]
MDQRVLFEVWKILQVFHEPTRLARENGVLAEPVVHVATPVCVPPPPPVEQTPRSLSVHPTPSDVVEKSNELETLERLLAFKEKSEKMPFVLVWSVIYQHLLLGRSQTPTNAFYSLKKINSQEKLEDELNKSNLLDSDDMVHIEGLIEKLHLRAAQPHKPSHHTRHGTHPRMGTQKSSLTLTPPS